MKRNIDTEKDLDKALMGVLADYGEVYKVDTIVGYGFPDIYFVGDFCCWIENKVATSMAEKIKFQAGQPSWLIKNNIVAKTFILIYYKNENVFVLYSGAKARELQLTNGASVESLATYTKQNFKKIYGDLNEFCRQDTKD